MPANSHRLPKGSASTFSEIPLEKIHPDPDQPRKSFDEDGLRELVASIEEHGVIQPIVVELNGSGAYHIQAGERRWRAAQLAGLATIPAVIGPPTRGDRSKRLLRALVENLQREDLNPIDEARAYERLQDELGLPKVEIARRCAVSPARVDNRLVLLQLDPEIQELVAAGRFSKDPSVGRALMQIPDREARIRYATSAADRNLTVRGIKAGSTRLAALLRLQEADTVDIPSLGYATRRRPTEWNLVRQIELEHEGRMPPWETVRLAAEKTCDACSLRDMASAVICGPCPAVELVAGMIEVEANRARKRRAGPAD